MIYQLYLITSIIWLCLSAYNSIVICRQEYSIIIRVMLFMTKNSPMLSLAKSCYRWHHPSAKGKQQQWRSGNSGGSHRYSTCWWCHWSEREGRTRIWRWDGLLYRLCSGSSRHRLGHTFKCNRHRSGGSGGGCRPSTATNTSIFSKNILLKGESGRGWLDRGMWQTITKFTRTSCRHSPSLCSPQRLLHRCQCYQQHQAIVRE